MATPYSQAYTDLMMATSNASVAFGTRLGEASSMMGKTGEDALKYINQQYAAAQGYLTPFRVAGEQSIGTLNNLLGVNGAAKQTQAMNNIITPSLQAMQSFGQQTANQAMASFLGVVMPNYNIQANLPAINQANQNNDPYANMSRTELGEEYGNLKKQYDAYTRRGISTKEQGDYAQDLQNQMNQINVKLGNGFIGSNGIFTPWQRNQDGSIMTQADVDAYNRRANSNMSTNQNTPGTQEYTAYQNWVEANKSGDQNKIQNASNFLATVQGSGVAPSYMYEQAAYIKNNPNLFQTDESGKVSYIGPGNSASQQSSSITTGSPGANGNYSGVMGGIVDQVTNNPLVQNMIAYQQEQGLRAYQNSAAAKGLLNSGRALEELQRQGQGLAATNVMPLVNALMQQTVSGVAGIQQAYLSNTMSGGAALAGNALSSVQSGLSNMVSQGNQAAQAQGQLAGQQAQLGSAIKMDVGKYQADARILQGKVESDALNAMAQIQFGHDMGPYIKNLAPTPQASGQTTAPFMGASNYFGGQ